jgi:RNA polymerase sigma factor (sigma-70 family)
MTVMPELTADPPAPVTTAQPTRENLESELERHRVELTAYCYRMLGGAFEAEDAVQETFVRAWRAFDKFEGRSAFRSWLYRIATNVCLDMLGASQRRARPMDLNPASSADNALPPPLPESAWIEPIPDERVVPSGGDPAEVAIARESVRLAPERVESHYYLALCLARASEIERTAKYLDEFAAEAAKAIGKNEKFDRAGPLRALGLLHLRTEGKLLAGFGDLDEALRHLGRAALLFPEDAENQIAYAEALLADDDITAARRAVAAALASSAPPELEEEHRGWLEKARKLRERIEAGD